MRGSAKLDITEINRLIRYIPKVGNNIDYYAFLKMVERIDIQATNDNEVHDIKGFAEKLAKWLKMKKFSINSFLNNILREARKYEEIEENPTPQ